MLEAVLYFVLGLLSAGLLALMVAPAIWNRAVILTKRRIESSVPLTLNEIQADKDQLRAEFAMSTRRLEMSVEELRENASRQVVEINRKRDELSRLTEDSRERLANVQELEATASDQRAKHKVQEEKLKQISQRYDEQEAALEVSALEFETMKSKLVSSEDRLNSQRIELVARDATIDNLNHAVSIKESDDDSITAELQALKRQLASGKARNTKEKRKNKELETSLKNIQKQHVGAIEKLERRERDLNRLRETVDQDDASSAELNRQLIDEKSRTVELEAKLAKQALQTEALLNDASNENVQIAMASVNQELETVRTEVRKISRERNKLSKQLAAGKADKNREWADERRDNAILRERINDMAAQVTALTATLEGDESPINKILASNSKAKKAISKSAGKVSPESLADRIRALQEASGSRR